MAGSDLKNSTSLLLGMRVLAAKIKTDDNQSPEAIKFAEYFTDLDEKLSAGPDFPRDWLPF